MEMDGVEFFRQYSGLVDPKSAERRWLSGTCGSCSIAAPVTPIGDSKLCRRCVILRITYPTSNGKDMRLGKGCFALVSPTQSIIWSSMHVMTRISNRIEVKSAKGQQKAILSQVILTPPEEPFVFAVFGPRNWGKNFVINDNPDSLQISNLPLTTVGSMPVRAVNRKKLADLIERFPGVTATKFDDLIKSRSKLFDINQTREDAVKLRKKLDANPELTQALPWINSAEHLLLRQIA